MSEITKNLPFILLPVQNGKKQWYKIIPYPHTQIYKNGNYIVSINTVDGTKVRWNPDDITIQIPSTVESFDFKITNSCDKGCPMCHENSIPNGKHGDIMHMDFIDKIHPWTEIAIGGGNPLEHPDLDAFLEKCKNLNLLPNITINQVHFERDYDRIKTFVDTDLVKGVGISLTNPNEEFIEKAKTIPTAVIHVIAGLITKEQLIALKNCGLKVLILGYKKVRRGANLYNTDGEVIDNNIEMLSEMLPELIDEKWFDVLSFDNLALNQLNVQDLVSEEQWNECYMGDDGIDGEGTSATIFIDAVEKTYAKNSCMSAEERFDIGNLTIDEMFHNLYPKLQEDLKKELEKEKKAREAA